MEGMLQEKIENNISLEDEDIPKKEVKKKSSGIQIKIIIIIGIFLLVIIIAVIVFHFVRTKNLKEEIITKDKCINTLTTDKNELIAKIQEFKSELYSSEKRNSDLTQMVSTHNVNPRGGGYNCQDIKLEPTAKEGVLNNLKDTQKKKKQASKDIMEKRLKETVVNRIENAKTYEEQVEQDRLNDEMNLDMRDESLNKNIPDELDSIIDTIE